MNKNSKPLSQAIGAAPTQEPDVGGVFDDAWIVLRVVGGTEFAIHHGPELARIARKALMRFSEQPPTEILSGHRSTGEPTANPHLAIVALPVVGHESPCAPVVGVALIPPRAATVMERRSVQVAVLNWERATPRTTDASTRVLIYMGRDGSLELEREDNAPSQGVLAPAYWSGPARRWLTATPIALDNHPGDLWSINPRRHERAQGEAGETIALACINAGLPRPVHVTIERTPPTAGAAWSQHYPPFPNDRTRTRRALTHATITFDRPVTGPLILGAGRFLGLGLLQPEGERE